MLKVGGTSSESGENTVLGTVTRTNPLTLNLEGKVHSSAPAPSEGDSVKDRFTLVLKIRKKAN